MQFLRKRILNFLIILTIFTLFTSCTNNKDSITNQPEEIDLNSVSIKIISGNHQTGKGGKALDDPIVAQVVNKDYKLIPGIELMFLIIEGDGRFTSPMPVTSDQNGLVQVGWEVGVSYNAAEVSFNNDEQSDEPVYIYAVGDNPTGMAVTRSLNTLKKEGDNFYSMSFYGDHTDFVKDANTYFLGSYATIPSMKYSCSLFSVFGNSNLYLYGRSFDNPSGWKCLTLLGEYDPPDGYKSLAFSRMQDYGYQFGMEIEELSKNTKMRLFESAGHVPDGINECGVVAGLANVRESDYEPDMDKDYIWITVLVRKILDGASNINEAIDIANHYNICCPDHNTLGIHVLVADATGQSVILEMNNGVLEAIPNSEQWQVMTNSPVYNLPFESQQGACRRFNTIYDYLEDKNGSISLSQGLYLLQNVGYPSTEWSAMYNLTERSIDVSVDYNFNKSYQFQLEEHQETINKNSISNNQ